MDRESGLGTNEMTPESPRLMLGQPGRQKGHDHKHQNGCICLQTPGSTVAIEALLLSLDTSR